MSPSKQKSADGEKCRAALAKLEKEFKAMPALPPLEQLVFSILAEDCEAKAVYKAMDVLRSEFVDWNECRVARREEIARGLDSLDGGAGKAVRVRDLLNNVFDLCGSLDLSFLGELKPSEARRAMLDIDNDMQRSTLAMILFELCPGTTIPVGSEGLSLAKKMGLVAKNGTKQQLQKNIQAELDANEAARLVYYLDTAASGKESKPASKKKASRKGK